MLAADAKLSALSTSPLAIAVYTNCQEVKFAFGFTVITLLLALIVASKEIFAPFALFSFNVISESTSVFVTSEPFIKVTVSVYVNVIFVVSRTLVAPSSGSLVIVGASLSFILNMTVFWAAVNALPNES